MTDLTDELCAQVASAAADGRALYICGGGSKRHLLGRAVDADELAVAGHCGIVDYQPTELVLTARAGTRLSEITAVLDAQGQQLPFDPPLFDGRATLGGNLACNLSGPARPWQGSMRDATLGVRIIDGNGRALRFGGEVVKNVAGYDVSRLQAGALGTLGVITEVSLKVAPRPEQTLTLSQAVDAPTALELMRRRAREPKPLTGAAWIAGRLFLRLAGAASAVQRTAELWGGDHCAPDEAPWDGLRELSLPWFGGDEPLWRQSTDSTAPLPAAGETLIDWGGAQRWWRGPSPAIDRQQPGMLLFAGGDRRGELRPAVAPAVQRLQQRLKDAFDPARVLNPGRLHGWM